MRRLKLIALILIVIIPTVASSSDDGNDNKSHDKGHLQGDYSYSISQKCEVNIEQVIDNLQFLTEPILLIEWSIDGIAKLRKDGLGESTFRALRFISGKQTTESRLSGWSDGMCELRYEVNQGRHFVGQLICNGTNSDGKSFTTSEFQIEGSISQDKQTIVLSDADASEEVIDVDKFGTLKGICGRSGTAVKLHENKDD